MSKLTESSGYAQICNWMENHQHEPFDFQRKTWEKYSRGYSGLVNAPTGFGKTFSVFLAVIIDYLNNPKRYSSGLKLLWVSPLRSLAGDLQLAMQRAVDELGINWRIEVRNGDTNQKVRQRQSRKMPDVLIITPESLHLLIAQKKSDSFFQALRCVAVDEWHELLGSKRGVLTELGVSYLNSLNPKLSIWGISATIGNIAEAQNVLLFNRNKVVNIKANLSKKLRIEAILPDDINELPWAGHLGGVMAKKLTPIINNSRTTLVFTNTRKQAEYWYQLLLNAEPDLAGQMAIHHGSIDKQLRNWIEDTLHSGELKAVVCTSSLDLGVDFQPVDTVIQIGSTKGLARLIQRAGRSGHRPHAESVIYLVPTHTLELIDIAALKTAFTHHALESRLPLVNCMDVLVQYAVSRAVGAGFHGDGLFSEIKQTHAYQHITKEQWQWVLQFITVGGESLKAYDQYKKVSVENTLYQVTSKRVAMIHRHNIGTIVSDSMMQVKFSRGGHVGMVEESFLSRLKVGDKFILAGRVLELRRVRDMTAYVKSSSGKAKTANWLGGRLPLSSPISHYLREQLTVIKQEMDKNLLESKVKSSSKQQLLMSKMQDLMRIQALRSVIPSNDELLIERTKTREGYHYFVFPFEGRAIHEIMSALIAYRLSLLQPISLTIAMNDYGFELLAEQPIKLDETDIKSLFSDKNLKKDILNSINSTEVAQRTFRDIAVISGLVIQNYPRQQKSFRGLQASAGIIFNVLSDYEPNHPLIKQAYEEVFSREINYPRLNSCLEKIQHKTIKVVETSQFTPLSFPIKVDSLRVSLSNEALVKRITRMQNASRIDIEKRMAKKK